MSDAYDEMSANVTYRILYRAACDLVEVRRRRVHQLGSASRSIDPAEIAAEVARKRGIDPEEPLLIEAAGDTVAGRQPGW
jgi:DNA-directed RNA polymerase specialized sigma24 family protein